MKTNTKIALFAAAVGMFLLIRKNKSEGVGKVERIKRRIYKEVSLAQQAGVDFSKKFPDLTSAERDALRDVGESVGWKQSKRSLESGKSYVESYYNSLHRAWNAVSGIEGVGRAWSVKDADGNVVLTWIEDAAAHVEAERRTLEAEARAAEARRSLAKTKRELTTAPATQTTKDKNSDYEHRLQVANLMWDIYRKKNPYFDDSIPDGATAIKPYKYKHAVIADAYARNAMRIRNARNNGKVVEVQLPDSKEWHIADSFDGHYVQYAQSIIDSVNNKNIEDGFARDDLNDIRRELLDKAKHMHVSVPYDEQERYYDIIENKYIRGDNRYKALELINWILWIHQRYERGGDVYYPMYSFATKEDALLQTGGKMKGNGFKIIPIWEVPIKQITGVSGIGSVRVTDVLEPELLEYIRTNIDPDEAMEAMDKIDRYRIPLSRANSDVQESIQELVNDWCDTNGVDPDDIWSVVDEEDILWAL